MCLSVTRCNTLTTLTLFAVADKIQCRTCVAVHQLPFGAKMEIECIAFVQPVLKL